MLSKSEFWANWRLDDHANLHLLCSMVTLGTVCCLERLIGLPKGPGVHEFSLRIRGNAVGHPHDPLKRNGPRHAALHFTAF